MNKPESTVLISRRAYTVMREEVDPSPVETGGVMVGVPCPPVVVTAGAGGHNAIRQSARFSGDTSADRASLEEARRLHGQQLSVVGYYHKHPPGMNRWSGQDLRQAREIVSTFNDGHLLLVGIFAERCPTPEARLFLYGIRCTDGQLEPLRYEIVKDEDVRIREVLVSTPAVPDVQRGGFWSDEAFCFYENPVGRSCIRQDLAVLRESDWQLTTLRTKESQNLRLIAQVDSIVFELHLPREYPLNPPRLFVKDAGELVGLDVLQQWNSERTLLEVVRSGLSAISCPHCRDRHLRPRKTSA